MATAQPASVLRHPVDAHPPTGEPPAAALASVRDYHQRSKHQLQRYAAGPETLDWDAQPDPWRRFAGAPLLALPLAGEALPARWPALFRPGAVPAQPLALASVGAWLQLALGLSAWKQQGPDRWAVRCNPSSGNLHPTEAYVLARGVAGLADGLHHFAPREHALARRARLTAQAGTAAGLWLGLSSIHWREAWKYGERAFRYCLLDLGHALGALRYAAAVLGWRLRCVPGLPSATVAALLGLDRDADFAGAEREEPELLLQLSAGDAAPLPPLPDPAALGDWAGRANRLDAHPMYRWPVIEAVAAATRTPAYSTAGSTAGSSPGTALPTASAPPVIDPPACLAAAGSAPGTAAADAPRAADLILRRRSAQRFDRRAPMAGAVLQRLVAALQPSAGLPWDIGPAAPRVHVVFFVHRVQGWAAGAYLLPRGAGAASRLAGALAADAAWTPVPGSPLLRLTDHPALAGTLRTLCCHQALASDANLALALLGEFDRALAEQGPPAYRALLQEAGLLGQVLYLEAEAAGHRGTGIGCFFDDAVHQLLGIGGSALQSLYHFTLGSALDDPRIGSAPPYADRPQERTT